VRRAKGINVARLRCAHVEIGGPCGQKLSFLSYDGYVAYKRKELNLPCSTYNLQATDKGLGEQRQINKQKSLDSHYLNG